MFRKSVRLLFFSFLLASRASADSTLDLQWAVCETNIPRLVKTLGFGEDSKLKQATYYDDANFSYTKNDLQLKVEMGPGKGKSAGKIKSTVKVGLPQGMTDLDAHCELDRYGQKKVRRCSITQTVTKDDLWTAKQKKYFESYAGPVKWKDLFEYGPYTEEQWETQLDEYEIQLEVLYGPNHVPLAEISLKTTLSNETSAHKLVVQWLSENKVKLCPVQQGKAKRLSREVF